MLLECFEAQDARSPVEILEGLGTYSHACGMLSLYILEYNINDSNVRRHQRSISMKEEEQCVSSKLSCMYYKGICV